MLVATSLVAEATDKMAPSTKKKGVHLLFKMASFNIEHLVALCLATFHLRRLVTISSLGKNAVNHPILLLVSSIIPLAPGLMISFVCVVKKKKGIVLRTKEA